MPSVIFLSNYYTHHQHALSQELHRSCEGRYTFIETAAMPAERIAQGWSISKPEYVVDKEYLDLHHEEIEARILESDLVIWGSAPYSLIKQRLQHNKITFLYSERIYKKGLWKLPYHMIKFYFQLGRYKNHFLLCASAYASYDYSRCFCFRRKAYKWGYFPEVKCYSDIEKIIELKRPASMLWVGRLIDWKHPEVLVHIAQRLKADGYKFKLSLIGIGPMEQVLKTMIADNGLEDCVCMLGSMTPDEVRTHMVSSQIFLFTSDRNEGWGAVLNEAMNSGCAVVASHAIGSVPFLIEHGKNGFIYADNNANEIYDLTKQLLNDQKLSKRIGKAAYETLLSQWNAANASRRLLYLYKHLVSEEGGDLFTDGVCSKASYIKDNWF